MKSKKTNFFFLLFVVFFISANSFSFAQAVRFRHLTVDDGLSQNTIGCIHQDKKGFVWIGTYDGLNKYDGNNFITWKGKSGDSSTICGNAVKCFYEDNEGVLWFGTLGGGMFSINLKTNEVTNFYPDTSGKSNSLSSDIVNTIGEYEPGKLWIATPNGLNIYDKKNKTFTLIKKEGKNAIPFLTNSIRSMVKDARGHIWFAHFNAGILEYDPKTKAANYYTADPPGKLKSNSLRNLFLDSRGWLWISEWIYGQEVINTKTGERITFNNEEYGGFSKISMVSQYYEDRRGNMWLATAEDGLVWFNPKTKEYRSFKNNADDPESLSDNTLFCVTEDNSGLIWSGTWKGGVNILDPKSMKFGLLRHDSKNPLSINDNKVQSFCKKNENEIYVGTNAAISVFHVNDYSFTPLPINANDGSSLRQNSSINHILQDTDSSLWICTGGGGLYHYDVKKNKYENFIYGKSEKDISYHTQSCTFKDSKGRLWILTLGGGLNQYDYNSKTFKRYYSDPHNEQSLSSDQLGCILERADGKLWIGSSDNGLNLFDPETEKTVRYITDKNGKQLFPNASISSLLRDRKGRLWLGTGSGLVKMNENSAETEPVQMSDPIFSSLIYSLTEDNSGNLWFSTSMGLCRFNPETKEYKVFNTGDGLQGREFNVRAVHKTHGGKLLFGGLNGMNIFIPEDIRLNAVAPKVALTGFSVLNQPYSTSEAISYLKEINLDYTQYFFSFDFACFDFTNPTRNNFAYKMEGFNDDWVEIGNKHSVTFTNLDPGEYRFLVKAANNDGFWSAKPASIKITISPPFWKTTWFYILCGLSTVCALYVYIRLRERTLLKEKMVLEEKVNERTAELQNEKAKVETAHKDIKDSIVYAQKIQSAILPERDEFKKHLRNFFILFQPKDIVSGDFYWISQVSSESGDFVFYATADCTGHGVPGGFMTMLGHGLLNELVNEKKVLEPAEVLNQMRDRIISSLKQTGKTGENKDGMDITLCRFNKRDKTLCYAAANNPCILVRGNEVSEFNADKQPVGIYGDSMRSFTQKEIQLQQGDILFTFTDGYADQFGGPKGKKLKYKNMVALFSQAAGLPVEEQEKFLSEKFTEWKGEMEQLDDVLVIGVKV